MTLEPALGRVTITWPKPNDVALLARGISVHDADTGEQLLDVTALNLAHGTPTSWDSGPLHVTLTRLVDAEGQPSSKLVPTDEYWAWRSTAPTGATFDGQEFRTADFTYLVAEMRIAQ